MRAGDNLDQVEGNGNREKRMDSRALWEIELTGLGLDWTWSVDAGSADDSWSSDLRAEKCGNLEEKRLGKDPVWRRRS